MVVRATPPRVGVLCHPLPWVLLAPFTGIEEDGLPCVVQGLRLGEGQEAGRVTKPLPHHEVHVCPHHLRVLDLRIQLCPVDVRVAPIHLDICSSGGEGVD